jgi:hypothetical protein
MRGAIVAGMCLPLRLPDAAHQWWCRLLSSDDLTGMKRLYGGHPEVADQAWCPVTAEVKDDPCL